MADKYNAYTSAPDQQYAAPAQWYQQAGYPTQSASQAFFSDQPYRPQTQYPYSRNYPQYEPYRDAPAPYCEPNRNYNNYSAYQPPPPPPRYSTSPQYQYQQPGDRAPFNTYGTYDPYAALPSSRKDERGLMGAVGGGAAGMVGGELLGDHPISGALAGAYLGSKMEKRHERKKHERDELFFDQ
ncbi:hypothetical protein PSPO01_13058 [Paraphaeosphaeria sporulosa]